MTETEKINHHSYKAQILTVYPKGHNLTEALYFVYCYACGFVRSIHHSSETLLEWPLPERGFSEPVQTNKYK